MEKLAFSFINNFKNRKVYKLIIPKFFIITK